MPTLDDLIRLIDAGCSRKDYAEVYTAVAERFGDLNNWTLTRDDFSLGHIGLNRRPRKRGFCRGGDGAARPARAIGS